MPSLDYPTVPGWMRGSLTALLLILMVLVGAWHSQLGLRVVIEDYVHGAGSRTLLLVLVLFAHVLLAGGRGVRDTAHGVRSWRSERVRAHRSQL